MTTHRKFNGKDKFKTLPGLKDKRRSTQRCDVDFLTEVLESSPPLLEWVRDAEVYNIDEEGNRKKRICARPLLKKLPDFVPDGIVNPHNVVDPYAEYVCLNTAGFGRGVKFGPCKFHNKGKMSKAMAEKSLDVEELKKDGIAIPAGDLQAHLGKVRSEITPDELYEPSRALYELEALKSMLVESMVEGGLDVDAVKQIADIVTRSSNVKLTQAKFESKMLKNKNIERLVESLIHGMLAAVEKVAGRQMLSQIMEIFKNEVLLPINEDGFSELNLRQKEAGLHDKYEVFGEVADGGSQLESQ